MTSVMTNNQEIWPFREWLDSTLYYVHWTQSKLAKLCGVTVSATTPWLQGTSVPDPTNVAKIAKALNVDVMRLMVNVGHWTAEQAGVDPLPMPPVDSRIRAGRAKIMAISGIRTELREALYEQLERGLRDQ